MFVDLRGRRASPRNTRRSNILARPELKAAVRKLVAGNDEGLRRAAALTDVELDCLVLVVVVDKNKIPSIVYYCYCL